MPFVSISNETATAEPWGHASTAEVLPLLQAEYRRWNIDLGWDLSRDWAAVDPARRTGLLPGWIARDSSGRPVGWAFAADTPDSRQLGALIAQTRADAEVVLRAVTGDVGERPVAGFVRTSEVVNTSLFVDAGFAVQPFEYLVAPTTPPSSGASALAGGSDAQWRSEDLSAVAELFDHAYAADRSLRPFAVQGTRADWVDYVDALTQRPGCGVFSPAASIVLRERSRVVAAILVTSVGATTAHIAQIAVAPDQRRRRLGWALVSEASRRAALHLRASRISLLVSTANTSAVQLYTRAGFRREGEFLAIRRSQARTP